MGSSPPAVPLEVAALVGALFASALSLPVAVLMLAFDTRRGNPLAAVITAVIALAVAAIAGPTRASAPSLRRPSGSADRVIVAMALLIVVLGDVAVATVMAFGRQPGGAPCVFTLFVCGGFAAPDLRQLVSDIVDLLLWGPLFDRYRPSPLPPSRKSVGSADAWQVDGSRARSCRPLTVIDCSACAWRRRGSPRASRSGRRCAHGGRGRRCVAPPDGLGTCQQRNVLDWYLEVGGRLPCHRVRAAVRMQAPTRAGHRRWSGRGRALPPHARTRSPTSTRAGRRTR